MPVLRSTKSKTKLPCLDHVSGLKNIPGTGPTQQVQNWL